MDLAVRTDRDPKVMIPELREVLRQADPALAGSNFTTMDQVVEDSFGSQRLASHLLEIFGGSALLLCVAGLYGLLAYVVSQRTRELGVRLALGAQRGDLLWLVMRQASVMLVTWRGDRAGAGCCFGARGAELSVWRECSRWMDAWLGGCHSAGGSGCWRRICLRGGPRLLIRWRRFGRSSFGGFGLRRLTPLISCNQEKAR